MTKYKEALKDARKAKFPDEAQKDVAIGDILGDIGRLHVVDAEYRQTIAYEKAAIAIGGDAGSETLVCFSNFKLKRYKETLATCTKAIDRTDDPEAHYWRGFTYQHLGQTDAAIKDFTAIAGSQSSYRPSSANEVSIIYDKQKQFRQALAVLDRYPYLFDPKIQTKKWLAISYNNRCYDYMELGQLKKALADCTESLKYGSLPDAYRKEQELAKRLRDRGH